MEYAMELNNITQIFSGKCVLNHINLKARKGEVLGLLGPSGAGKTTLIKIITGQLKQTNGTAHLFGKNITPDCRKIGIMMDDFGLYDRLSVYVNMKFYAEIYHVSKERILPVLQKVGLLDAKNTAVSKLSKGMRNRLSFARAVLKDVDILFLDEPTSGLDPATTKDIHKMLLEEKEKGTTIFLTTHNMFEAESMCDNIALLNQGKIVEYGNPQDICRKYNHLNKLQIRLQDGSMKELPNGDASAEQIKDYLSKNLIVSIHSTEPNLEKIFIELTGRGFE